MPPSEPISFSYASLYNPPENCLNLPPAKTLTAVVAKLLINATLPGLVLPENVLYRCARPEEKNVSPKITANGQPCILDRLTGRVENRFRQALINALGWYPSITAVTVERRKHTVLASAEGMIGCTPSILSATYQNQPR